MNSYKKEARAIGILFLIALLLNIVANEISKPILDEAVYLQQAYPHQYSIVVVNLLNIVCGIAMIFIPIVLLFVVGKPYRHLALGYLVFRALEGILFIYIAIKTSTLIDISQLHTSGQGLTSDIAVVLGKTVQAEIHWATEVYLLMYCCGAVLFYYLLFKAKTVPNWLSVWGLASVLVLCIGTALAIGQWGIFRTVPLLRGMVYFAPPVALNELVLAIWFIVKGVGPSAQQAPVKSLAVSQAAH